MRTILARIRSLWRALVGRSELESDMDDEFQAHIEMRTDHLIRQGMAPKEAARKARLEFGSTERFREEGREARGLRFFDELRGDLLFTLRSLRREAGFTTAAVLTLALGVGANSAAFSFVNASVLRPLPFEEPERLVVLQQTYAEPGGGVRTFPWWSPPQFEALRLESLSGLAAFWPTDVNLAGGGESPVRVRVEIVSSSYFRTLRLEPFMGRGFSREEELGDAPEAVVVLGHGLWRGRFAGDPDVLGSTIRLNGIPLTVVGVAPEGFRGVSGEAQAWIPHEMGPAVHAPDHLRSDQYFLGVIGRLRGSVSLSRARAEVAQVAASTAAAVRESGGAEQTGERRWGADLAELDQARRDPSTLRAQLVLAGAAIFVLLIAAVNLSGLLLARASARARETAARAALGAGRARLIRQFVVEGSVLGALGGALGIAAAFWAVPLIATVAPDYLGGGRPRLSVAQVGSFARPTVDWRVVAFGAAAALLAGVIAAVIPALRYTRGDLTRALKAGARGSSGGAGSIRRPTLLSAAAILQIASTIVLLSGAGAMLSALHHLHSLDAGFEPRGVITFELSPPRGDYDGDAAATLHASILREIGEIPGVRSATVGCAPFGGCASTDLDIAGRSLAEETVRIGWNRVGPEHFETLGVPVLRGRALTPDDRRGAPRVALIDETTARRFWPDQDPVGQRISFGYAGFESESSTEIVGVVADLPYAAPGREGRPMLYTSYLQFTRPSTTLLVRAAGDPSTLIPLLRQAVAEVDPDLAVHDVRTLDQHVAAALRAERFATAAIGVFAALGLLLAALGIHGIMAFTVARRVREIGIRMALGATPASVRGLVVGQGLGLAGLGVVIGATAAIIATRALPSLIPGAGGSYLHVYAVIVPLLLGVVVLACWVPARRATRIEPVEAIAGE